MVVDGGRQLEAGRRKRSRGGEGNDVVKRTVKVAAALLLLALTGCGYHAAGHTDLIPKTIKTICIPAFTNSTTRYKLSDRIPGAITQEFNARTRYHVVSDCSHADAELRGSV